MSVLAAGAGDTGDDGDEKERSAKVVTNARLTATLNPEGSRQTLPAQG
jgi:hypothetical protein